MAGYLSVKMKRKDLEEVYDDFSDFSLSSPARKIRRLDAELPPIMEEEEPGIPFNIDQILPEEQQLFTDSMIEAVPSLLSNEERALVLYNPMSAQLLKSPSSPNFTIMVNSDLIPGFKSFLSGNRDLLKPIENEYESTNKADSNYLAVVPWVSSQSQFPNTVPSIEEVAATEFSEPMEAEEEFMDEGGMEIEVDNPEGLTQETNGFGEGQQWMQQQQQQHCMSPQLPQNTYTPIMWS